MKTVFTSNEIAHVWAHKSAPHGRCPSNISFDGDMILSYATAIARHVTHKGKAGIIVNDTSYSNSTAKHYGKLRSAIPEGVPVFYIGEMPRGTRLDVTPLELFTYAMERAKWNETKASRAKKYAGLWANNAAQWMERAEVVSRFYGLRKKVDWRKVAKLRLDAEEAERQRAIREEKLAEIKRIADQENYAAWKEGYAHTGSFAAHLFPVAFRVEGDELVSTLGARVPMQAARIAYRFAMSKRGQAWRENGETCEVGMYRLNAINEHGIVAGCHRIAWVELERLASVLA